MANDEQQNLKEIIELMGQRGLLEARGLERTQQKINALQNELGLEEKLASKVQIQNEIQQQTATMHQQILSAMERQVEHVKTLDDTQRKILSDQQRTVRLSREQAAALQTVSQRSQTILKTFTGIDNSIQQSLVAGIGRAEGGFKQLGQSVAGVLTPLNSVGSLYQKMIQGTLMVIKNVDQLSAALVKETGFINQSTAELESNWRALGNLGASLNEVKGATAALNNNMSQFNVLGTSARTELVQLTTKLGMAGASMEEASRTMNLLNRGFGMGASEITRFYGELTRFSESLGMSLRQVNSDLAKFASVGAKYGKDMMGAFKDLEKQAKVTGLSMQQLLSIAGRFDTFESAAQSVGKLNALLGGPYLSAIDMLYAKEGERVQMLRQTISETGRAWSSMNRFEQQAIAAAAGINDMAVATQLFGSSASEYAKMMQSQRELATLSENSKAVLDRLQEAFMKLTAAASPFMGVLEKVVSALEFLAPKTNAAATAISGALVIAVYQMARSLRQTVNDISKAAQGLAQLTTSINSSATAARSNTVALQGETQALVANTQAVHANGGAHRIAGATRRPTGAGALPTVAGAAPTAIPSRAPAAPAAAPSGGFRGAMRGHGGTALLAGSVAASALVNSRKGKGGAADSGFARGAASWAPMGAMLAMRGGPWGIGLGAATTLAGGIHGSMSPESYAPGTGQRGVKGPKNAPRIVQAHGGESIVSQGATSAMESAVASLQHVAGMISTALNRGESRSEQDRDVNVYIGGEEVARAALPAISRLMGITQA